MRRVGRDGRAIVRSFSYPKNKDELIENIDDLARKEGSTFSEVVVECLEKRWKEHGCGNPAYTLDKFQDPNFVACPALFADEIEWNNYLRQCNSQELEDLKNQIIMIDNNLGKYL